ncbi:MAG: hypothetical protein RBU37_09485 [Myxococcota bacterium]|jgi:hypothetical protein|nr:hypothetical protein [Myxococcota bacterium]
MDKKLGSGEAPNGQEVAARLSRLSALVLATAARFNGLDLQRNVTSAKKTR